MTPNPIEVGNRIRNIRKNKLGLSMDDFGYAIDGKARSGTVSNWETGKNLPNNERLKRIAKLGDITINELVYGSSESYIRKLFDGLKNIDDELIPFIINGLHNTNNYYPSQKEVIDEYNEVVDIINDSNNKFTNKRDLANNLITTGRYLNLFLDKSVQKNSLITKAIDENESAIKNYELYFEENITEQPNPKKIN